MAIRVSSPEDAGCFCFNLDSGLTRALPKERPKSALCPLFLHNWQSDRRESCKTNQTELYYNGNS